MEIYVMSKLKELGIDIEAPITWLNADRTSAQAAHGVHPFGIDLTATPAHWEALMADIAEGLVTVQEMPPAVGISLAAMAGAARVERNRLLAETDWTQIPDAPILASKRAEWATYRKALRDLTGQAGFPQTVVWPQTP
jgi:hypothetical protein